MTYEPPLLTAEIDTMRDALSPEPQEIAKGSRMYTVQFNDGRLLHNVPSGEARMWLLLSIEAVSCNVYHACGSGAAVCYID